MLLNWNSGPVPLLRVYGTTLDLLQIDLLLSSKSDWKRYVKPACDNCLSLVSQGSANQTSGLQYYDWAPLRLHVMYQFCNHPAVHAFWCPGCQFKSQCCCKEHFLRYWRIRHCQECESRFTSDLRICSNCLRSNSSNSSCAVCALK